MRYKFNNENYTIHNDKLRETMVCLIQCIRRTHKVRISKKLILGDNTLLEIKLNVIE